MTRPPDEQEADPLTEAESAFRDLPSCRLLRVGREGEGQVGKDGGGEESRGADEEGVRVMRRYYREMDGSMDPADDGEWVRWEDAESEVAQLREVHLESQRMGAEVSIKLRDERAAHEATKAELADMQRQRDQAGVCFTIEIRELKARVAELTIARDQARGCQTAALDALDQARGLLERCHKSLGSFTASLCRAVSDWLRAHPATATPAATGAEPERNYIGPKYGKER